MQGTSKVDSEGEIQRQRDKTKLRELAIAEEYTELKANPRWREQNTKAFCCVAIFIVAGFGVAFGMPQWLAGLLSIGAFVWLAS